MPGSLKESSGTGVFQQIARVSEAAWPRADPRLCPCSSSNWGTQLVVSDSLSGLLYQALGLSSHILAASLLRSGALARQLALMVTSLLIQRIQKKKITGAPLLFPPSLSWGLRFSQPNPPGFILTITRQHHENTSVPTLLGEVQCVDQKRISILILLSPA